MGRFDDFLEGRDSGSLLNPTIPSQAPGIREISFDDFLNGRDRIKPSQDTPEDIGFFTRFQASVERGISRKSIEGLVFRGATGRDVLDIDPRLDPEKNPDLRLNLAEEIGDEIFGFILSPTTIATLGVGGLAGQLAFRTVAAKFGGQIFSRAGQRAVAKEFISRGTTSEVAQFLTNRLVRQASKRVARFGSKTAGAQGAFVGLSNIQEAAQRFSVGEDITLEGQLRATGEGLLMGTIFGLTGAVASPFVARVGTAVRNSLGKFTGNAIEKALDVAVETTGLVAGGAALEQRVPTPEDIGRAAGMVLGIKAGFGVFRIGKSPAEDIQHKQATERIRSKLDEGKSLRVAMKETIEEDIVFEMRLELEAEGIGPGDPTSVSSRVPSFPRLGGAPPEFEPGRTPEVFRDQPEGLPNEALARYINRSDPDALEDINIRTPKRDTRGDVQIFGDVQPGEADILRQELLLDPATARQGQSTLLPGERQGTGRPSELPFSVIEPPTRSGRPVGPEEIVPGRAFTPRQDIDVSRETSEPAAGRRVAPPESGQEPGERLSVGQRRQQRQVGKDAVEARKNPGFVKRLNDLADKERAKLDDLTRGQIGDLNNIFQALDPKTQGQIMKTLSIEVARQIVNGAVSFKQASQRMVRLFGQQIKPFMKRLYQRATDILANSRSDGFEFVSPNVTGGRSGGMTFDQARRAAKGRDHINTLKTFKAQDRRSGNQTFTETAIGVAGESNENSAVVRHLRPISFLALRASAAKKAAATEPAQLEALIFHPGNGTADRLFRVTIEGKIGEVNDFLDTRDVEFRTLIERTGGKVEAMVVSFGKFGPHNDVRVAMQELGEIFDAKITEHTGRGELIVEQRLGREAETREESGQALADIQSAAGDTGAKQEPRLPRDITRGIVEAERDIDELVRANISAALEVAPRKLVASELVLALDKQKGKRKKTNFAKTLMADLVDKNKTIKQFTVALRKEFGDVAVKRSKELFALGKKELEVQKKELGIAFKRVAKHIAPAARVNMSKRLAQNIDELMRELPADAEFVAAAEAGIIKRGWYRRAAQILRLSFGRDTERFVGLLSALSPRQQVRPNMIMALDIYNEWIKRGRPESRVDLAKFVPQMSNIRSRGNNAMTALSTELPLQISGPKVERFRRNLLGDLRVVTADVWGAMFADVDPLIFGTKTGYLAFEAKINRVAKKMGLEPAEVQETIWSFYKTMFEAQIEGKRAIDLLDVIGDREIGKTPEFAEMLVNDAEIQNKLKRLGVRIDNVEEAARILKGRPATTERVAQGNKSLLRRTARRATEQREVRLELGAETEKEILVEQERNIEIETGEVPAPRTLGVIIQPKLTERESIQVATQERIRAKQDAAKRVPARKDLTGKVVTHAPSKKVSRAKHGFKLSRQTKSRFDFNSDDPIFTFRLKGTTDLGKITRLVYNIQTKELSAARVGEAHSQIVRERASFDNDVVRLFVDHDNLAIASRTTGAIIEGGERGRTTNFERQYEAFVALTGGREGIRWAFDADPFITAPFEALDISRVPAKNIIMSTGRKSLSNTIDQARTRTANRIKKRLNDPDTTLSFLGTGQLIPLTADIVSYGALTIAKGAVDFSVWSVQMVQQFGDEIKPHLQKIFLASQSVVDRPRDMAKILNDQIPGAARQLGRQRIKIKTTVGLKYAGSINKALLGLGDKETFLLEKHVSELSKYVESLEATSHDDIVQIAKGIKPLENVPSSHQATQFIAGVKSLRDHVATLTGVIEEYNRVDQSKLGKEEKASFKGEYELLNAEYARKVIQLSEVSNFAGRLLNSFKIIAEQNNVDSFVPSLLGRLTRQFDHLGRSTDELIKAAQDVDWNSLESIAKFYRLFNKPTFSEFMREFRLINLLSSPLTHLVNTGSAIIQLFAIRPAILGTEGVIDAVMAGITGKPRQRFVGDAGRFYAGAVKALSDARIAARDSWNGKLPVLPDLQGRLVGSIRPDLTTAHIPSFNNKFWNLYRTPLRALEMADQFFMRMAHGGETRVLDARRPRGFEPSAFDDPALGAKYLLFRNPLDPSGKVTGQGAALQFVDRITNATIMRLRELEIPLADTFPESKIAKSIGNPKPFHWVVPFVITPTNILKQGFELSPLGFLTIPGSANNVTQVAKAVVGTTMMGIAGILAAGGNTTFGIPKSKKERELFFATGRKRDSIKIGDKWVPYGRLGPIAYPIAMATAFKERWEDDPTDDAIMNMAQVVSAIAGFFTDQSYLEGVGSVIDAVSGEASGFDRALANFPRQAVPYTSFQGWVTRMLDPVYRKASPLKPNTIQRIVDDLKRTTPGLSYQLTPYTEPDGKIATRPLPMLNAFNPFGEISPVKPRFEAAFQAKREGLRTDRIKRRMNVLRAEFKKGTLDKGDFTKRLQILSKILVTEQKRRRASRVTSTGR